MPSKSKSTARPHRSLRTQAGPAWEALTNALLALDRLRQQAELHRLALLGAVYDTDARKIEEPIERRLLHLMLEPVAEGLAGMYEAAASAVIEARNIVAGK